MYDTKRGAEKGRFGDKLRQVNDRAEVLKIAKQMPATNWDVVGEKRVKNNRGLFATSDQ